MAKFTLPLKYEIGPFHPQGEDIDGQTLLVTDAEGREFTLVVEAQEAFEDRISNEAVTGIESDGDEPVFLIPGRELMPAIVAQVLDVPPELLEQYLVEQLTEQPTTSLSQ